jgi:hypothetical protein
MTYMPRLVPGGAADWADLTAELDRWGEAERVAALWWRDDDAVAATPALTRLLRLAGRAPVAFAVIPAQAGADLAEALCGAPAAAVMQHGWGHINHARSGKRSEYPPDRPAAAVTAELGSGRARINQLFGSRVLPVLVPPWNRFAPELLPVLPGAGITGLSTMAGQLPQYLRPGITALDVHVDLVDWRGGRGFVETELALGRLVGWLRAQRLGMVGAAPIGILTHHLMMDDATAAFLGSLLAVVGDHVGARWAAIAEHLA